MKVAIFEVCRRPEILKPNTEAKVLSVCFADLAIDFDLFTNDGYWADRPKAGSVVDRDLIQQSLTPRGIDVAHFAVHGGPAGFALSWGGPLGQRTPLDVLTGPEIREMTVFRDKLVVSGACGTAGLADDFLAAGATAFVAPKLTIPWENLGVFFRSFYASLKAGLDAKAALASATSIRPELSSTVFICK